MNAKQDTRQVVKGLLAKGTSVRVIADKLRITTQAVYYHVKQLEKGAGDGPTPRSRQ